MKKYIIIAIVLFLTIAFFHNCTHNDKELLDLIDEVNTAYNNFMALQKISKEVIIRDRKYIGITVEKFIESRVPNFHGYKRQKISSDSIEVFVEDVFYSTDKLKLVGFVVLKLPKNKESSKYHSSDYYHDGYAIAGFRNNSSKAWKIYPLNHYKLVLYEKPEDVTIRLKLFYFKHVKNMNIVVKDNSKDSTEWIKRKNMYNINEEGFWSSIIWQKGSRLEGLYNFQTKRKSSVPLKFWEIKYPAIEYPDSLLNLF